MEQRIQVAIQILVWVELRGVGRQEEQLDVFRVLFQPVPNLAAVMHTQVVQNQKTPCVRHPEPGGPGIESAQGGCHRFPVKHEANFTLIGDGRDYVGGKPVAGYPLNRCLACWCTAPAVLAIATDACFVPPCESPRLRPWHAG